MVVMNFNVLMKEVAEALRLDNESNEKEAYKKYIGCIFAIASNLMDALRAQGGEVVVNQAIMKQVKLAQQCTERVAELVITLNSYVTKSHLPESSHQISQPATESDPSHLSQDSLNAYPNSTTVSTSEMVWAEKRQPSRFSSPVPALPSENNPHTIVARKSRTLTPMEKASKQNQSLMAAYKARMLRLNRADFNAFNYSLTIQRKMAENIAIAKAQEEELARKMQARNQRLELETAKRFTSPTGMSDEEKEQRAIYKNILEYENEAHWLKKWREKLAASPEDPVVICQLVQEVLRCSDHPITELLKQYQFKIYQRLFPLVEKRAQNLAQIKVPFAEENWPVYEDVKDLMGDTWEPNESIEDNPTEQGNSEDCQSNEKEHVMNDFNEEEKEVSEESNVSTPTLTLASSEDRGKHPKKSSNFTESNIVPEDADSIASQTTPITLSTSTVIPQNAENKTEYSTQVSTESMKSSETAELSRERKQAQLLMKQVSKRYTLDAFASSDEDEDLDYLFEDDAESFEITENMYSSLSNIRNTSEKGKSHEEVTIVDGKDKFDVSQCPNRSASHEFQSSSSSEDQVNSNLYQSLPYCNFNERTAEAEEAKRIAKLSLEACERHLTSICEDIHRYLDKLLVLLTIAYEPLDTPVGKDQCAVSLEEPFFKPIWKTLLLLFRVVNSRQEQVLACVMTKYSSATLGDLSVNKKLWLTDDPEPTSSPSSPPPKEPYKPAKRPYEKVITELQRVGDHYTMLSKLECVVKVCRLICECVEDHFDKPEQGGGTRAPSIGADDLLPILCYVVVQSAMPQLASECQAMAEFIQEGYLMGEEGYCLTTLRTALGYVTSLYFKS
ncbi:vps9 domain-containing 1 [Plakobranchus ocellatus]|uniref:Vps9 domain-containing 1 n=1 Tax=Plakobranchus ocellatus TaxID=259542 RepID=A0AAV4DAR8_9GAST|nr:vps9 domain-containing 1 [Plakobranchus ocellatus]